MSERIHGLHGPVYESDTSELARAPIFPTMSPRLPACD